MVSPPTPSERDVLENCGEADLCPNVAAQLELREMKIPLH